MGLYYKPCGAEIEFQLCAAATTNTGSANADEPTQMRRIANLGAGDDAQEGERESRLRHDASLKRLRCLNCGQNIFVATDADPPEICQYCDDITTWRLIKQ